MHFLLFPFSSHKTISDIARRKNVVFSRRAGISAKTHYRRVCLLPTYFLESVCGRTSLPFRPVHKGNKKNNIGLENFVLLYIKQDENKC